MEIESKQFRYEHLFASSKNLEAIKSFKVNRKSGKGLEIYLKENAPTEEINKSNRTYFVKEKVSDEIAGYSSYCKICR